MLEQEEEKEYFAVWPENWKTVEVFLRCSTQWVFAGMSGVPMGLNYPGVEVVMRRCKVPANLQNQMFEDLQLMENAALSILNKRNPNSNVPKRN